MLTNVMMKWSLLALVTVTQSEIMQTVLAPTMVTGP